MLRKTSVARGFESWPWPTRLPLSGHWYTDLNTKASVSKQVRGVQRGWDLIIVTTLGYLAYRASNLYESGAYQTRLKHLNNTAPAIVAQDFDFTKGAAGARQVSRARLDEYRTEFESSKTSGASLTSFIFKY